MDLLIEPLTFGFMQTAFAAAVMVGTVAAVFGVFVVLRGLAFISDALAHTALPGLVVAYLNGWNLFWGALGAGLATAAGIAWLSRRATLREDTAIGILFSGFFALGVALISATQGFRDLTHILFGDILSVAADDLWLIGGVGLVAVGLLFLCLKEVELTTVDPVYARVIGINPDMVRLLILILLTLAVIAGLRTVGVILISALLVTPAAAASLVTRRLPRMMALSVAIAVGSSVTGLYASYYWNVASGAAIVLVCTGVFGLIWLARTLWARAFVPLGDNG